MNLFVMELILKQFVYRANIMLKQIISPVCERSASDI